MMRILALTFFFLLPALSFARTTVSGTLRIEKAMYYLVNENNKKFLITQDSSQSALASLLRLSQGDYIYGQGTFQSSTPSLKLTSVDYVGLKKLLGSWEGSTGVFYFKSFTEAAFYSAGRNRRPTTANIRYSTAPSNNNSWVVFLSEKETTLLSTIVFEGNELIMSIYLPETGDLHKTLRLKRWTH
jgi:hypothetical protein